MTLFRGGLFLRSIISGGKAVYVAGWISGQRERPDDEKSRFYTRGLWHLLPGDWFRPPKPMLAEVYGALKQMLKSSLGQREGAQPPLEFIAESGEAPWFEDVDRLSSPLVVARNPALWMCRLLAAVHREGTLAKALTQGLAIFPAPGMAFPFYRSVPLPGAEKPESSVPAQDKPNAFRLAPDKPESFRLAPDRLEPSKSGRST